MARDAYQFLSQTHFRSVKDRLHSATVYSKRRACLSSQRTARHLRIQVFVPLARSGHGPDAQAWMSVLHGSFRVGLASPQWETGREFAVKLRNQQAFSRFK